MISITCVAAPAYNNAQSASRADFTEICILHRNVEFI